MAKQHQDECKRESIGFCTCCPSPHLAPADFMEKIEHGLQELGASPDERLGSVFAGQVADVASHDPSLSLFSDADLVSLALDVVWALGLRRRSGYGVWARALAGLATDDELRAAIEGRQS